jgi:glycosyltransferase involved in cell wall biosynthesis
VSKKYLIFISRDFPYGYREPCIEEELKHLSGQFRRIFLFAPKVNDTRRRQIKPELPENVILVQYQTEINRKQKLKALKYIFTSFFWKELSIISRKEKKLSYPVMIRYIIESLARIENFYWQLSGSLKSLNIPGKRVAIYSYHLDDITLSACWLKRKYRMAGVFSRFMLLDDLINEDKYRYQLFRTYMLRYLDGVFPVSQQAADALAGRFHKMDKDDIVVSRLGFTGVENKTHLRDSERLKVLSVSFLEKYKRVDLLIDALENTNIQLDWVHISDAYDEYNIRQNAFNTLFNKENIKFRFSADMNFGKVIEYFRKENPDVFISTSKIEDIPKSIIEALSFGIPVIACGTPAMLEFLKDGVNGFVLPEEPSVDEINLALLRIYKMTEQDYQEMRLNAFNTWKDMFDSEVNYPALMEAMMKRSKFRD